MRHLESKMQQACVRWFRLQHPRLALLLFHPKNEGHGSRVAGAIAKAEGVVAGVSDLILLVPNGRHHILCLEMKTKSGRQSVSQKAFQKAVEAAGGAYHIVRDIDTFICVVNDYVSTIDPCVMQSIKEGSYDE